MKRKHILLKNEIDNLQRIVMGEIYVADFYKANLVKRLQNLKVSWYKDKKCVIAESKFREDGDSVKEKKI